MYPTMEEVEKADRYQLCKWWRFLHSPGLKATDRPRAQFLLIMEEEGRIMDRIRKRFDEFGGFTPEISKALGWD